MSVVSGGRKVLLPVILLCTLSVSAQVRMLDDMENTAGWVFNSSDGVEVKLSEDVGVNGKALRFDYDFTRGTGYGGIQHMFAIDLPENFEFSFYLKAESPANNFEVKFIDSTGNNVWWVNNRNYSFPSEWKKIKIKKRHVAFAWGPAEDKSFKRVDRIEFTIASFVGGKGTIWLDELKFEALPPETENYPQPLADTKSSLKAHPASFLVDGKKETSWQGKSNKEQTILLDFTTRREFGGVQIDWEKDMQASDYDILLSEDGQKWDLLTSITGNRAEQSFIRMPEAEAGLMKIVLKKNYAGKVYGIKEIRFLNIRESMTMNDFLINVAGHSVPGNYPRYFHQQASFWTVAGVNNDVKEALINEDGMVEVEKARFSVEPMIMKDGQLYNWSNVSTGQSLVEGTSGPDFTFLPSVSWDMDKVLFRTAVATGGEANTGSVLGINYFFENKSSETQDMDLYLLVRPLMVNPYYQFLNNTGGAGRINHIGLDGDYIVVDDHVLFSQQPWQKFSASSFEVGNIVDLIRDQNLPGSASATDRNGQASAVIKYIIHLAPGEKKSFYLATPFYGKESIEGKYSREEIFAELDRSPDFWSSMVNHIHFNLPSSADQIIATYKSNLAYILINRDNAGIQPGSRSYERSWIRDGALTSSALLKSGIVTEVRDFINWYSDYQYDNGKIPCVVDFRGPDPVPENDSHGEYIYLVHEYFMFTKDTTFLRGKNEHVLKAVDYIKFLIDQRSTEHFKNGNDSIRAYYGLVPESISHEGYSAKPMHSYWDDFFTLLGLKEAVDIQRILGNNEEYARVKEIYKTFEENLYNSLDLAMKQRKIDYIPGCVELGDFDATSTTIALTPCNELANLPKPQVYNTFDRYFTFFRNRRDGKADWVNYTPYENRLIGSFIILDQPERAHELIDYFMTNQRPKGWNHWAEVVWHDMRYAGFIGDMPHTWVGSDFVNAIRTMFVYENDYDKSLVLGAALYQDWIDAPDGMSVENLPTYYGELSYSVKKEANAYHLNIYGTINMPEGGLVIRNFSGSKLPEKVTVNGKELNDFSDRAITIREFPAEVVITY